MNWYIVIISSLPVIDNICRITEVIRNLFSFDAKKYGLCYGSMRSVCALFQVLAMETMNIGANEAIFGERFLTD